MSKTVNLKIQIRRDTANNWSTNNPILAAGEIGFDLTNGKHKIGDGLNNWSSLPYFVLDNEIDVTALTTRIGDLETAVGTGGSVDSKISSAISGLDSSIASTSNQAIASVTLTDGKITGSTKITVPTNNNQLTNGAGYQTASDVSTAIATAVAGITSFEYEVVQSLPAEGEAGVIYLVAHSHGTGDSYDEYIWVSNAFEKIGNTDIDLSGYVLSTDLVAITSTEINTICV